MGNILSPHTAVREHFITTGNPAGPKAETHRYKLTGRVHPTACIPQQTPPTSSSPRKAVTPFYTHCLGVVIFILLKFGPSAPLQSHKMEPNFATKAQVTQWAKLSLYASATHLPQTSLPDKAIHQSKNAVPYIVQS